MKKVCLSVPFALLAVSPAHAGGVFAVDSQGVTGQLPTWVEAVDIDGDTIPELLVTNRQSDSIGLFFGNGNGEFGGMNSLPTGSSPNSLTVADLNGDTFPDLATANDPFGGGDVSILFNDAMGFGLFSAPVSVSAGTEPSVIASADIDGDDDVDLVVTLDVGFVNEGQTPDNVAFLRNNGDGTFAAPTFMNVGENPTKMAMADVRGIGVPDLVLVDEAGTPSAGNTVHYLTNDGAGNFSPSFMYTLSHTPTDVELVDVNNDTLLDLVATSAGAAVLGGGFVSAELSVRLATAPGVFEPAVNYPTAGFRANSLSVGDINDDGFADAVITHSDLGGGTNDTYCMLNNGDGSFGVATLVAVPVDTNSPQSSVLSDFDNDGDLDLAIPYSFNERVITFINGTLEPCPADFNHDGTGDFFDLLDFLDRWFTGAFSADFNGDTVVDFFDLLDFLDAWFAGC